MEETEKRAQPISQKETVRDIVNILEPVRRIEMRKKRLQRRCYNVKGPNHMWHIDENDKLKPFGFFISAAIDGWSRYILWIDVDVIDNDHNRHCRKAWVNTSYNTVRIDKGTEHVVIADVQTLLHLNHDDGFVAVMVGSSNYNQRIERWWGYCRDSMLQYYMDLFKDLQSSGVLQMNKSILNRMRNKNRQRRI